MHALAPLLFIFILFNNNQLKVDKFYRANVFALVGTSYFFLLQYTVYWYRIFPTQNLTQYLPGLVVVLSTIAIALSPWNKRSHLLKTLLLCSVFALTLVVTFTFDKTLKETLAEVGGFFQSEAALKPNKTSKSENETIELPAIGIRLQIPKQWQQHQLPSGHIYFTHNTLGETLLEIRPNCLEELDIDTPTYLFNILHLLEATNPGVLHDYRCTDIASNKTCLVQVKYPSSSAIKEKWHWLEIPSEQSRSFAIDFIIKENSTALKTEIWEVIAGVEALEKKATEPCRTPAAWL